jgi:hypothetical protein
MFFFSYYSRNATVIEQQEGGPGGERFDHHLRGSTSTERLDDAVDSKADLDSATVAL